MRKQKIKKKPSQHNQQFCKLHSRPYADLERDRGCYYRNKHKNIQVQLFRILKGQAKLFDKYHYFPLKNFKKLFQEIEKNLAKKI